MDTYLTPPVAGGFGSTPTMVMARSSGSDQNLSFEAETSSPAKTLFALTKSKSGGWTVGPGWLYCGLTKVDVEETSIGSAPETIFLNVMYDDGEFTAEVSSTEGEGEDLVIAIPLYQFEGEKLVKDGRNVMFLPLYN